jgi:uncharacterized membrane protein YgcG
MNCARSSRHCNRFRADRREGALIAHRRSTMQGRGRGVTVTRALFALCAWLAAALYGPALHARTLHWSALDVTAALDSDGRLHVVERHSMVFDGDWNGGERRFRLSASQQLRFVAARRIDPLTGAVLTLRRGALDRIDDVRLMGGNTLRWRSRLPSDPPFAAQTLVYEIEYVLSNVLRKDDAIYLLDHDFAFPDRDGAIEKFTLDLAIDPAWTPPAGSVSPLRLERTGVPPGASVVVTLPLRYRAGAAPAGVRVPGSAAWLGSAAAALLVFAVLRLRRYLAHERRNGRFEPLPPVASVNEAWLAEHVFKYPPEKVGALWDNRTGAAEVAAVLARLVQEGKLTSRVERRQKLLHAENVLVLTIATPRPALNAYEHALIKALFVAGNTTDTEVIREHYSEHNRPFDPGAILRRYLPRERASDENRAVVAGRWKLTALLALVAAGALGASVALEARTGLNVAFLLQSMLLVVASVVFGVALAVLGLATRGNVMNPRARLILMLTIYATYVAVLLAIAGVGGASPATYVALVALAALVLNVALNRAYTRVSPAHLATRRNFAAARAYFVRELERTHPRIEDSWYPYLVAFGLDAQMDRWFGRFGPTDRDTADGTSGLSGAQTQHSTSAPAGWSGGGGRFGGGGASGAWSAAAGAMAAGVPVSDGGGSSGGSGGGGGGASSGGGGGGGW